MKKVTKKIIKATSESEVFDLVYDKDAYGILENIVMESDKSGPIQEKAYYSIVDLMNAINTNTSKDEIIKKYGYLNEDNLITFINLNRPNGDQEMGAEVIEAMTSALGLTEDFTKDYINNSKEEGSTIGWIDDPHGPSGPTVNDYLLDVNTFIDEIEDTTGIFIWDELGSNSKYLTEDEKKEMNAFYRTSIERLKEHCESLKD